MADVYIIESWFGERRNVRHVYAADADDALQTHALHYPGERILSVQAGMGLASDELLAQLVGVVLLVGFVGAYFWWIFAALGAVAAGVLRPPVVARPPSTRRRARS